MIRVLNWESGLYLSLWPHSLELDLLGRRQLRSTVQSHSPDCVHTHAHTEATEWVSRTMVSVCLSGFQFYFDLEPYWGSDILQDTGNG